MANINFPNNPSINQTFEANGVTYIWTGNRWSIVPKEYALKVDLDHKLDNDFAVFRDVESRLPPEPELDSENRTKPQTVTFTRSFLQGAVRITQHVSKDHTGEEVLIYEIKETL